jgi:hypothetical protein
MFRSATLISLSAVFPFPSWHGPWPRDQQTLLPDDGRRHHGRERGGSRLNVRHSPPENCESCQGHRIGLFAALHESACGVRRGKAALSSGCKSHSATAPAGSDQSSHGGNELAEAFGGAFDGIATIGKGRTIASHQRSILLPFALPGLAPCHSRHG